LFKYCGNSRIVRIIIFLFISLWFLGLSFPVISSSTGLYILTPFLKRIYAEVCHQERYKSISIGGQQFLVCSRCLGIYTGILLSSFFSIFITIRFKKIYHLLIISVGMMFADILFYTIGLYEYSKIVAFGTGLFLGSISFPYILNEFENYLLTITPADEK
jgi:uncharacterized membrane protein